jgi:glycosyltransferase involved in cell wall biosynthesis
MPTYNQARFLGEAVRSVLNQTLQDFEIVIYDDASTDNTGQVVKELDNERIRYFRNSQRHGIAANRNKCLAAAGGQYIAWLDSDDIYHPNFLAVQCAVLDANPRVGLIHGAYEVIDQDGTRLPDWKLPFSENVIEYGKDAFRELVLSNYITTPTVVVRSECHQQAGPFATDIGPSSTDWDMWLRIVLYADLAYTAVPLAQYRQHPSSISAITSKNGERLKCDIRVIKRIFSGYRHLIGNVTLLEKQARSALCIKALIESGNAFTRGDRIAAIRMSLQGICACPSQILTKESFLLPASILLGNESGNHRCARAVLSRLYPYVSKTRYSDSIRKVAEPNPVWEKVLADIAQIIREVVPKRARLAVVDKWDPTLLHLSRRGGWHFPDRRMLPDGYPGNSKIAIDHLELLRKKGASYLAFPSASFWWLDHYEEFRDHLESRYRQIWNDELCILYDLSCRNESLDGNTGSTANVNGIDRGQVVGIHG